MKKIIEFQIQTYSNKYLIELTHKFEYEAKPYQILSFVIIINYQIRKLNSNCHLGNISGILLLACNIRNRRGSLIVQLLPTNNLYTSFSGYLKYTLLIGSDLISNYFQHYIYNSIFG